MNVARRFLCLLVIALGAFLPGYGWAQTGPQAESQIDPQAATRAFGHQLGDILEQRIALQAGGRPFTLAQLPRTGRATVSLWRRDATVQTDARGEPWLVMHYQIINVPQELTVWTLPALHLNAAPPSSATLDVPAWPFSVAPFTAAQAFNRGDLQAMRADRAPAALPLAPYDARVRAASACLAASLLLWAGWAFSRRLRHARRLPFSRAVRDLRALPHDSPDAWRRLQHALNDAAGEVVRMRTLDRLIARAPYLARERPGLEQFLRQSSALFFGDGLPADALSVPGLARRLRRLERQAAS